LAAHQVVIDREQWITEAENSEKSGFVQTCHAIIRETISMGVDEEDRKSTWMEDAENVWIPHNYLPVLI
jgi:pre-mRNA-processing factor 6